MTGGGRHNGQAPFVMVSEEVTGWSAATECLSACLRKTLKVSDEITAESASQAGYLQPPNFPSNLSLINILWNPCVNPEKNGSRTAVRNESIPNCEDMQTGLHHVYKLGLWND